MEDSVSLVKEPIVEEVSTSEKVGFFQNLDRWDHDLFFKMYRHDPPKAELLIMKFISIMGSLFFWISLSLVIYIISRITDQYTLFSMMSGMFDQSILLFFIVNYIFKRPRPFVTYNTVKPRDKSGRGFSFPSGHTTFFMIYGFLFSFYFNSPLLLIITIGCSIPLAYSRIKLGVHYPLDTIVGIIFGVLVFLSFWFGTQGFWMFIYDNIVAFFKYVF